jgi:DNA-binding IclR family transcriptional regulator
MQHWDLVDPKIKRILDTLVKNKGKLTHLKKLSKDSNVPAATTFRLVKKLIKLQYISVTTVGKIKLYMLADNKKTGKL